jgi:hypothetical protein
MGNHHRSELAKLVEDFETFARAKGEPTKRNLSILAFLKT